MPVDHLGFSVTNYAESRDFYAAALKPLGYKVVMEVDAESGGGLGDKGMPSIWLSPSKTVDNRVHLAFTAPDRKTVDAFYDAAIKAGGKDNGKPGIREQYHPNYYGAFVLDRDGHNIEAVCHTAE
jgi:catechol 2,3-dioxygenase-like lactoylglutathione lyase family enzyme